MRTARSTLNPPLPPARSPRTSAGNSGHGEDKEGFRKRIQCVPAYLLPPQDLQRADVPMRAKGSSNLIEPNTRQELGTKGSAVDTLQQLRGAGFDTYREEGITAGIEKSPRRVDEYDKGMRGGGYRISSVVL